MVFIHSGLLTLLFLSSYFDIRDQIVPNRLSLSILGLGCIYLLFLSPDENIFSLSSIFITLLLTLPGYFLGQFGAADVKILLAIALITPYENMLVIIILSMIIFIVYKNLFAKGICRAPFVPAIFIAVSLQTIVGVS
ncbi:prepilin peptidase [Vibrio olivae]|uniref:Prepilin peptidase n=1 Tax=Vibrio olivae TaxID=1243002 RepID=A0ABV5HMG9_9VIBR